MSKRVLIACAAILAVASSANGAAVTYVLQTPGVL
jgi:hypothetical protein